MSYQGTINLIAGLRISYNVANQINFLKRFHKSFCIVLPLPILQGEAQHTKLYMQFCKFGIEFIGRITLNWAL